MGCVWSDGKEMLTKLTWSHSGIISCADLLKITLKYPTVIFGVLLKRPLPVARCQLRVDIRMPVDNRKTPVGEQKTPVEIKNAR